MQSSVASPFLPPTHLLSFTAAVTTHSRRAPAGTNTISVVNVICSRCPQGVRCIAAMDNDNEMMMELLMKEEADAATDREK
jgi:hypothetical protein